MSFYSSRNRFDTQLGNLESGLLDLSSMVEKAVNQAIATLKSRDHRQALKVIEADRPLNEQRYGLEMEALSLLALQQPVLSRDLRYIAAVIHIAGELERMGDYAKGIARISDNLSANPPVRVVVHLEQMARLSNKMLHAAMDAFIEHSITAADEVARQDDDLDELYNIVYRELLDLMIKDNSVIDLATMLLWAAHNLERMGDRVTNICERIRFVETGILEDSPGQHQELQ
ncbi:MAG TPA: phosphate signaling complex protein PhoU [Chloroflexia bacterium]|nr:phosphate signaling complex protein PhoU [Chloroflexia bacterium]